RAVVAALARVRPAARARCHRLPGPNILPCGRARGRHGLPGAPPSREHLQLVVPARAGPGRFGRRAARAAGVRPFTNEPTLELRRSDARESLLAALRELDARLPIEVPVLAGGERVGPADVEVFHSTDPGEPERVVAVATRGGPGVAATAVQSARDAFPAWRARPAAERGGILVAAAGRR